MSRLVWRSGRQRGCLRTEPVYQPQGDGLQMGAGLRVWLGDVGPGGVLRWAHNPKVAGSNPAPATMNDEGLADAAPLTPFVYPDFTRELVCRRAGDIASLTSGPAAARQPDGTQVKGTGGCANSLTFPPSCRVAPVLLQPPQNCPRGISGSMDFVLTESRGG